MEANFPNFVPKHFAEENMLSIMFAGTGNFRFESLSQYTVDKNKKICVKKDAF
jgi:hypothetical protein